MEIRLDIDSEDLSKSFAGFSKLDSEFAVNTLRESMPKIDGVKSKMGKLQSKYEHRKSILDEHHRRMLAKQEALYRARSRYERSEAACDLLMRGIREQNTSLESYDYGRVEAESRLVSLNEVFSDEEVLQQRAMMIESIKHLLDPTSPIEYTITQTAEHLYTQRLSWVTSGLRLLVKSVNGDGQSLQGQGTETETVFGPFSIVISRRFSAKSMHSSLEARADNRGEALTRAEYYHPHISRDGEICLGTAKAELNTLMKAGDYAGVIYLMMGVITSYNPRDPYSRLNSWEPNRFDNYICSSCSKVRLFCDCSISIVSGRAVEDKFLSPCGCTYQECMVNHERTALPGQGINGTTCQPSRHGTRFTESGEQALSDSISRLQEYQNQLQENLNQNQE